MLINSDPIQQQQKYFCAIQLDQIYETYTTVPIIVVFIIIGVVTCHQWSVARQTGKINSKIKWIYITILSILAGTVIELIFAEFAFWIQYYDVSSEKEISARNQIYSKYLLVYYISQFLLCETMLLLVSFNWYLSEIYRIGNTIGILELKWGTQQSQKKLARQSLLLKIIKFYLFIRIVMLPILIFIGVTDSTYYLSVISYISGLIQMGMSMFVVFIFLYEIYLIKTQQILQEQQKKIIIKKYVFVLFFTICRAICTALFTFIQLVNGMQSQMLYQCVIDLEAEDWLRVNAFYLSKAIIKVSLIFSTLRIYHVEQNTIQQSVSEQNLPANQYNKMNQNEATIITSK